MYETEEGHTHREEGHVTAEADWREAATSPGTPAAPEAQEAKRDPPLEPPDGTRPC